MSRQTQAVRGAHYISAAAAIVCAAIFVIGYGLGYERLYHPWPNGPSTHPFTALALTFLALGTFLCRPFATPRISILLYCIALIIAAARLIDIEWGSHILDDAGLFSDLLTRSLSSNSPIVFGWNTAIAIAAAAIAGLSRAIARPLFAQLITAVALGPVLVSVVGYTYGMRGFSGEMSLYTTLLLFTIVMAMLLSTAHRSIVSMLLSDFVAGRLARQLILAILLIPFSIGLLIVRTSAADYNGPIAILVVGFALGDGILLVRVLMEVERLDRVRRKQERSSEYGASHDSLTKLANRSAFDIAIASELARSRRTSSKFSVVIFDIDKFKSVNDRFGHQAGDQVLAELGNILSRMGRHSDVVARYGGEEFTALLPDTPLEGAFQMAEKTRLILGSVIFFDQSQNKFSISLSAGVAENSAKDDSVEALMCRADRALYAAKAGGRDRTCIESATHTMDRPLAQPKDGARMTLLKSGRETSEKNETF